MMTVSPPALSTVQDTLALLELVANKKAITEVLDHLKVSLTELHGLSAEVSGLQALLSAKEKELANQAEDLRVQAQVLTEREAEAARRTQAANALLQEARDAAALALTQSQEIMDRAHVREQEIKTRETAVGERERKTAEHVAEVKTLREDYESRMARVKALAAE